MTDEAAWRVAQTDQVLAALRTIAQVVTLARTVFEDHGFSRAESVYLAGQLIQGAKADVA